MGWASPTCENTSCQCYSVKSCQVRLNGTSCPTVFITVLVLIEGNKLQVPAAGACWDRTSPFWLKCMAAAPLPLKPSRQPSTHFDVYYINLQGDFWRTNAWRLVHSPVHGHPNAEIHIPVVTFWLSFTPLHISENTYKPDLYSNISVNAHAQSLCAFCDLCAVHDQRVDDPVPPLPAAHGLHAAVVISQREMCFCAVFHKLPLQVHIRHDTCQTQS